MVSTRIFHISLRPQKYNREGGRKNKRTIWTWISYKRKKGSFVKRFCAAFRAFCRLSWACIFRETSTKATRNANSSLTVFPHCLLLLTVLPLDCYLTPIGLFCSPLSTALSGFFCQLPSVFSRTFLSSSTSSLAGDLEFKPFVWVSRLNKEIVCLVHHPHSSYSSRAITFTFGQIPLGKVWTPLFSLQLWVNSRTD